MRTLSFVLLFCFSLAARAEPIVIERSSSPDGKFYVTIEPSPDNPHGASGILQIRGNNEKGVLGSFEWYQYKSDINPTSAKVLWKPDSQAFALTTYVGKNWFGSQIYVRNGSKWVELAIPNYKTKYTEQNGWQDRGKGEFVVVAWLTGNIIKMKKKQDYYRYNKNGQLEVADDSWIYLKLLRNSCGPFLDVRSVEEKSLN